jgi:hypothetical protein
MGINDASPLYADRGQTNDRVHAWSQEQLQVLVIIRVHDG